MMKLVTLQASTGQIREADGVLKVPVVALVGDLVMHCANADTPELVPLKTLEQQPSAWNSKPVCHGHPRQNGQLVSASAVLDTHSLGTIANARIDAGRLLVDAHLDIAKAERIGASALLKRLRAGELVSVSVGAFVETKDTPGQSRNGRRYEREWTRITPDHLALLDSAGACSIEAGCFARGAEEHDYTPPNPYEAALKQRREDERQPQPGPCPFAAPDYDPNGAPPDPYKHAIDARRREEKR